MCPFFQLFKTNMTHSVMKMQMLEIVLGGNKTQEHLSIICTCLHVMWEKPEEFCDLLCQKVSKIAVAYPPLFLSPSLLLTNLADNCLHVITMTVPVLGLLPTSWMTLHMLQQSCDSLCEARSLSDPMKGKWKHMNEKSDDKNNTL